MEWLKRLRMQSIKKAIGTFLILLAIGLVAFVFFGAFATFDDLKVGLFLKHLPLILSMIGLNKTLIVVCVISSILPLIGLCQLIKAFSGQGQKQVRKLLEASGSFEAEAERAAKFYDSTEAVSGFRIGDEFVFFQIGVDSILLRPWDIAWAYQRTTTHKRNGFTTGHSYAIILNLMDGKKHEITMTEQEAEALLKHMEVTLPGTVLGYSDEIAALYRNRRSAFSDRWEAAVPGCRGVKTASSISTNK